jgi:hypothetical protein
VDAAYDDDDQLLIQSEANRGRHHWEHRLLFHHDEDISVDTTTPIPCLDFYHFLSGMLGPSLVSNRARNYTLCYYLWETDMNIHKFTGRMSTVADALEAYSDYGTYTKKGGCLFSYDSRTFCFPMSSGRWMN